jgi:hypothetical protein
MDRAMGFNCVLIITTTKGVSSKFSNQPDLRRRHSHALDAAFRFASAAAARFELAINLKTAAGRRVLRRVWSPSVMGLRGPPKGTPKTPGSGRKRGTPNKVKSPDFRAKLLEAPEAAANRTEAIVSGLMPLEYMLQVMRDEENPPGFRMEAAKAAAQYCHAKKADEPTKEVKEITEIGRVIVSPREVEIDEHGNGTLISEGR